MKTFFAYIERDPDSGTYFGQIPAVTGAYSQGDTLEELRENLQEALELCLEDLTEPLDDQTEFVGIEVITVSA